MSAECRPIYRPIVSTDGLLTKNNKQHVDRHSTDTQPTLGRHIGRVSVDISAECRSPYRPIVSTDTRSTDALSTHDPRFVWRRHAGAHLVEHQHGGRKLAETSVTEFCYKSVDLSLEELKNVTIILYSKTRTIQIVEFPEISHFFKVSVYPK